MATQYDPVIIVTFADRLYAQARSVVLTYAVAGLFVGAAFGAGIAAETDKEFALYGAGAVGVIGLLFGIVAGRARAFVLKLQAQQALCQVQIEQNTGAQQARLSAA